MGSMLFHLFQPLASKLVKSKGTIPLVVPGIQASLTELKAQSRKKVTSPVISRKTKLTYALLSINLEIDMEGTF
jgi:hypothetical protein